MNYRIRNERRIYPVTEEEFLFLAGKDYPSDEIAIPDDCKVIYNAKQYTLIIYHYLAIIKSQRRDITAGIGTIKKGIYIQPYDGNLELATCALCYLDHDVRLCKLFQSKWICIECREELSYAKATASVADYIARKRLATPRWADFEAIERVYAEARCLTLKTGIQHHVDHIIPIRGKTASGLHCEFNLQILTAQDNLKKSNKLI